MTNLTNIVTFVSLGEGTEGGGRQQRCQRLGRSVLGSPTGSNTAHGARTRPAVSLPSGLQAHFSLPLSRRRPRRPRCGAARSIHPQDWLRNP